MPTKGGRDYLGISMATAISTFMNAISIPDTKISESQCSAFLEMLAVFDLKAAHWICGADTLVIKQRSSASISTKHARNV